MLSHMKDDFVTQVSTVKGVRAKWGGVTPQYPHADAGYKLDDTVRDITGGGVLSIIWNASCTAPRMVDFLVRVVEGKEVVVKESECSGLLKAPKDCYWTTLEVKCGEALIFLSTAIHGGGCNHMTAYAGEECEDFAPDQISGHGYWPGRPIGFEDGLLWTTVSADAVEKWGGLPKIKRGICRTCESRHRIKHTSAEEV
jgi:hypothetical protein